MRNLIRLALAGVFAACLTGVAALSVATPAGDVAPHRHYVSVNGSLMAVGPNACDKPSMQRTETVRPAP